MFKFNENDDKRLKICKKCGYKIDPCNNSNSYNNDNELNNKSICIYDKSSIEPYKKVINNKLYEENLNVNNFKYDNLELTNLNSENEETDDYSPKSKKHNKKSKKNNLANDNPTSNNKSKKTKKSKASSKKHKPKN